MSALIRSRQIQIGIRYSARFLHESMKQDHSLLHIDIEEDARDSVPRQIRSDLV